ncbi:hypothetical protein CBR64_00985 [Cellulosimicrobium cellulans]|uniref:HTH luxR-type domain-containing protein n=1 Tax=Cellulosimicrobium cellulans TaxID=1710 RepID=A0A1Y0I2C1_CELCE|nr:hypothetical protein CBR64_00985 [Cellulosimicrobium cellulans]
MAPRTPTGRQPRASRGGSAAAWSPVRATPTAHPGVIRRSARLPSVAGGCRTGRPRSDGGHHEHDDHGTPTGHPRHRRRSGVPLPAAPADVDADRRGRRRPRRGADGVGRTVPAAPGTGRGARGRRVWGGHAVRRRYAERVRPTDASRPARDEVVRALTRRELEVLEQLAGGLSNAEIANVLVITPETVKTYVSRILAKLGLRDRVQAVVLAYRVGVVAATG